MSGEMNDIERARLRRAERKRRFEIKRSLAAYADVLELLPTREVNYHPVPDGRGNYGIVVGDIGAGADNLEPRELVEPFFTSIEAARMWCAICEGRLDDMGRFLRRLGEIVFSMKNRETFDEWMQWEREDCIDVAAFDALDHELMFKLWEAQLGYMWDVVFDHIGETTHFDRLTFEVKPTGGFGINDPELRDT